MGPELASGVEVADLVGVLDPLDTSADLLLAGELGVDVGMRTAPSWLNSDPTLPESQIIVPVNSLGSASIW